MNDDQKSPYAPPTAPLEIERQSRYKPQNPFVGVLLGALLGAIIGLPLLFALSMTMVASAKVGTALVILVSILIVLLWVQWSKWANKNLPFDLTVLILVSIFHSLAVTTLLFRLSSSYDRYSSPPNPPLNPDAASTIRSPHHAL